MIDAALGRLAVIILNLLACSLRDADEVLRQRLAPDEARLAGYVFLLAFLAELAIHSPLGGSAAIDPGSVIGLHLRSDLRCDTDVVVRGHVAPHETRNARVPCDVRA